jgi:hypothetical protein
VFIYVFAGNEELVWRRACDSRLELELKRLTSIHKTAERRWRSLTVGMVAIDLALVILGRIAGTSDREL